MTWVHRVLQVLVSKVSLSELRLRAIVAVRGVNCEIVDQAAAHLKTGEKETTTAIQISTLINLIRSQPRSQDTPRPATAGQRQKDGVSC